MYFRRNAVTRSFVRFLRDERGDITTFLLPMFIMLVFCTGLAIDLIRHEANRADLQNALDRGVLAAASFAQDADAEAVVQRYIDTRTFNEVDATLSFDTDNSFQTEETSVVVANASFTFGTTFLNLVGLPELQVGAAAAASEGRTQSVGQNEISLVLDISASMARESTTGIDGTVGTRLEVMKQAAAQFITENVGNSGQAGTSVTLVPYSGHVNVGRFRDGGASGSEGDGSTVIGEDGSGEDGTVAGADRDDSLFNVFTGGTRVHDFSSCIEFNDDTDFDTLDLPIVGTSDQVPHFQNFFFERLRGQSFPFDPDGGNDTEWGWCPTDDQALLPFSGDRDKLIEVIEGFHGHDGTGIQNGLKWGLGLLMPSSQNLITDLITNDHVSEAFSGRPAALGSIKKSLILMTDGRVRYQNRPLPEEYDTVEERDRFSFDKNDPQDVADKLVSSGSNLAAINTLLTTNPVNFRDLSTLSTSTERANDETLRQDQVRDLCNLARAADIRVFTIGFGFVDGDELADAALAVLQGCATHPGDFFDVSNGLQLEAAFNQITTQMQDLRLFQ